MILAAFAIVVYAAILVFSFFRSRSALNLGLLICLAYGGYVLPQVISASFSGYFDDFMLYTYILHAAAIMLCVSISWGKDTELNVDSPHHQFKKSQRQKFAALSYIFLIVGFLAERELGEMAEELAAMGGQWTGRATILAFFANLTAFGFAILLFTNPPDRNRVSWPGLVYGGLVILESVLIGARRGPALDIVFILLVYMAFFKGINLGRGLTVLGALAFSAYSMTIAYVRLVGGIFNLSLDGLFAALPSISSVQFTDVANGLYLMMSTLESLSFTHLFSVTDRLIERLVPGQLVGYDLKQALIFFDERPVVENPFTITGSTVTGIASSFESLFIFGFLWYLAIAFILKRYARLASRGSQMGALMFAILLRPAVSTIGFQHSNFFVDYVVAIIFILLPARLFISRKVF